MVLMVIPQPSHSLYWSFSNILPPYGPPIPFNRNQSMSTEKLAHKHSAVLFVIVQNWQEFQCPSTTRQVNTADICCLAIQWYEGHMARVYVSEKCLKMQTNL